VDIPQDVRATPGANHGAGGYASRHQSRIAVSRIASLTNRIRSRHVVPHRQQLFTGKFDWAI
jgi:hypothetical protein